MIKRAWMRILVGGLVVAAPMQALAANPTYYPTRAAFLMALKPGTTIVEDFSSPMYMFINSDAAMTAVRKQTIYNTTGFMDLNIVQSNGTPQANYCAGCNGSFRLTFTATTVGTVNGVFGAGVDVLSNSGYFAYITFGDNTTANVLVGGSFFGVSAPESVKSIHFGLSGGGSTQNGTFVIDNLTIGEVAVPPPPCMVDADCDDGNPCDGAETCDPVTKTCIFPGPLDCDDMNVCTSDSCDPVAGCLHTPLPGNCDDGDVCTINDQCNGGVCGGTPIDCDDKVDCTDDACDPMVGCVHTNHAGPCDDASACTTNDTCQNGTCSGTPVDCDDKNQCTTDACDPLSGCTHMPAMGACDDGNACTMNDTCTGGTCSGVAIDCDDKNTCTTDSCDPATGCKHTIAMGCNGCMVNGQTVDCDDKDVCTKDTCAMTGCSHTAIDGCCHDDSDCNQDEGCDMTSNTCVQVSVPAAKSGCSCRTPGDDPSSTAGWAAFGALAVAGALRRRRERRLI